MQYPTRSLRSGLLALALCLLHLSSSTAVSAESWADSHLTVTNPLLVWYDASRQSAARGSLGLPPITTGRRVDQLLDASGHLFHLSQSRLESRPRFHQDVNAAYLNFDGEDDALGAMLPRQSPREITLFLVAQPRSHSVPFQGFVAGNRIGANDYTSGFNFDLGPMPSSQLLFLNAEGAGFTGAQQLLKPGSRTLQQWRVFSLTIGSGPQSVSLHLDGKPEATRDRQMDATIAMDFLALGSRSYSNTGEAPHQQGYFAGNIAELLIFGTRLPDSDRQKVERYLSEKYRALLRNVPPESAQAGEGAIPLIAVTNPAPVQWFLPGFEIQRIPVDLPNVNNIRCREDGTLVAVCYDGKIWHLKDTDGDQLEDRAFPFWNTNSIRSPVGAALTPPGYSRGRGVFIAAKDKVTLITDTNSDDMGDTETVVATWTEKSEQQGVDALGVAVDRDGSILFGLGAASYTDAFLVDRTSGIARYHTRMERGTIQKVSPDFRSRQTVATGIRFSVGMALNARGDLFCTDQEGATWLPNGNPFDELLHIEAGRHFGFPPRHPRHLPDVINEPSVADFAPQHQSTCGFCFNEPVEASGPIFGPATWRGNALVTGYSRGKLWRTQLVSTSTGYVGQIQLLATFQSLVADVCISRNGDLIVATHSGQPDWGSGPHGQGNLFRIRHRANPIATHAPPLISVAWNSSPTECTLAFDRPIQATDFQDLAHRATLEQGAFVFPGDRFETIRPGYQVVYDQLNAPRYRGAILGSQLSTDGRQLKILTTPRRRAWNHVWSLPFKNPEASWELLTDLTGLQATWTESDQAQSLWWPHMDPEVSRSLTTGSSAHDSFWATLGRAGELKLEGQWNLNEMLQPAVQPGARLDYVQTPERPRLRIQSSEAFTLIHGDRSMNSRVSASSSHPIHEIVDEPVFTNRAWIPFTLVLKKQAGPLELNVVWSTAEDIRWRPMPLKRVMVPWAVPAGSSEGDNKDHVRAHNSLLAGGQWSRGRDLFQSPRLACSQCHTHGEQGGKVGPDLTNLHQRDYASIRKDIEFPNAALNPDHLAVNLETKSGELLAVRVLQETADSITVMDAQGATRPLARKEVASLQISKLSLMPEGLWGLMTETERRDLMTFLMTEPLAPHPVPEEAQGRKRPPARTLAEIQSVLSPTRTNDAAWSTRPIHVVLCASPKDTGHGAPGFHDYPVWRERWTRLLAFAENTTTEEAERWPTAEQWDRADVVAFYHDNPVWVAEKAGDLDRFLDRGGGLIFLHWSMNAYQDLEPLSRRLARAWGPGAKFRQGDEELVFHPSPITEGLPRFTITDETYWNLKGEWKDATVIASSSEEGQPQPQIWTREQGKGRVLVCIPSHYTWTFDDPLFRIVLLRGMAWASRQPVQRWEHLATIGARIQSSSPAEIRSKP